MCIELNIENTQVKTGIFQRAFEKLYVIDSCPSKNFTRAWNTQVANYRKQRTFAVSADLSLRHIIGEGLQASLYSIVINDSGRLTKFL